VFQRLAARPEYDEGVDRRTLPLLLASSRSAGADESQPLDRLRMQKGVFLLEQRGPAEWRRVYRYQPYNWGPYSSDLADDVDSLIFGGLLRTESGASRYPAYRTTRSGEDWLDENMGVFPKQYRKFVKETRRFVTTRSFGKLLKDVYAEYPEFATRSQFVG